jgi:hypothetical protein
MIQTDGSTMRLLPNALHMETSWPSGITTKPASCDHLKGSSALLVKVRESAESTGVGKEARVGAREGIRRGRTSAF